MMKFETIVSLITDFDLNKIEKYIWKMAKKIDSTVRVIYQLSMIFYFSPRLFSLSLEFFFDIFSLTIQKVG